MPTRGYPLEVGYGGELTLRHLVWVQRCGSCWSQRGTWRYDTTCIGIGKVGSELGSRSFDGHRLWRAIVEGLEICCRELESYGISCINRVNVTG